MSKQIVTKIKKPRETPTTTNHANRTLFCGGKTLLELALTNILRRGNWS